MWTSSYTRTTKDGPYSTQEIFTQDRKGPCAEPAGTKERPYTITWWHANLHRAKKTIRETHRKSGKVNEDTTHKPEGVPTPLSIYKHHSRLQLHKGQLQHTGPSGVVCKLGASPNIDSLVAELHQNIWLDMHFRPSHSKQMQRQTTWWKIDRSHLVCNVWHRARPQQTIITDKK